MGIKALRKIQIGEESTKGNPVAATTALLGMLTMRESPNIYRPQDERASMADFTRSVKVGNLAELTFEGDTTFEQVLYWLHMGVLGDVTPSVVDTDAKLWTFTPAMAAAGVFDSFTLEFGDDVQAWEVEYCMARAIEFTIAMNEAIRVTCDIFGRKMTATSFTGALSPPTVEPALGQKAKLYIDDEDSTIGTNELSAVLIGATYHINTGLIPVRYGDGSIDFSVYSEAVKGVELRITAAFKSGVETERLKFDGETLRLVRVESTGSLVGAVSAVKTLTLDACGIYTAFESLGEREGEDVIDFVLSTQLGANYTKLFEVAVQNAVGTLP